MLKGKHTQNLDVRNIPVYVINMKSSSDDTQKYFHHIFYIREYSHYLYLLIDSVYDSKKVHADAQINCL